MITNNHTSHLITFFQGKMHSRALLRHDAENLLRHAPTSPWEIARSRLPGQHYAKQAPSGIAKRLSRIRKRLSGTRERLGGMRKRFSGIREAAEVRGCLP